MLFICWQVAEHQAQLLERPCDIRLPARYRDYVIVKRNYRLHAPENVVSAAQVRASLTFVTPLVAVVLLKITRTDLSLDLPLNSFEEGAMMHAENMELRQFALKIESYQMRADDADMWIYM